MKAEEIIIRIRQACDTIYEKYEGNPLIEKEEWQSTDSGYLNCIGVGDTYVRRQIERILRDNHLKAKNISYWPVGNNVEDGWIANVDQPQFVTKDNND